MDSNTLSLVQVLHSKSKSKKEYSIYHKQTNGENVNTPIEHSYKE